MSTTLTHPGVIGRAIAPGPRGSLIFGNLTEYKRDPIGMLLRLRLEYGDVARNRLGPYLTHALAHPQHVKHVLQDNAGNYVRGRFYERFKLFFGDGLLTTDGDFWLRHRRIAQPLFHRRRVETISEAMTTPAAGMIERWHGYARNGSSIDVVPEMMRLTLSTLGKVIFNSDLGRHAEEAGPAVRLGLEAMMPQGNINDFIPQWIPTPLNGRIHRARRALYAIMRHVVEEHRSGRSEASDLITMMLSAKNEATGEPLSEREVRDELMTVFLAGHETTGSGLAWTLYALSMQPQVLRRLQAELEAVLGTRVPTAADLPDLPYLTMVIEESLRLYPPIWGYTRDAVKDDEIGGFHIPAGSSIFVSPYVTHRHPGFWQNPEAFDPDRFAPQLAAARPRFAYFPFGGGPRQCIGIHIAKLQMQLTVAMIVQHFDLHALPGHSVRHGALVSLRPVNGILLTLHPVKGRRNPAPPPRPAVRREKAPVQALSAKCPFSSATAGQVKSHE